jgi:hypothetical protein
MVVRYSFGFVLSPCRVIYMKLCGHISLLLLIYLMNLRQCVDYIATPYEHVNIIQKGIFFMWNLKS